jgi:YVTN family beta-propeller protein
VSTRIIRWLAILLAAPLWAQEAAMAVVEKKAGMVAFYTADGKRLSAVKVGLYPHEMAFSTDRRLLFVSDNGVEWMTDTGKGDNTLSVIDIAARKKVGVIDLGQYYRPHGILVLPKNGHLVGEVAIVNLASGKVEKTLPTGKNPQGAVMTKDEKWVFLTNTASNTISVIDTVKRAVVGEIKTSDGPARIVLTPDENTLVYNLLTGSAVGFADIQSRKETSVVSLPGRPLSLSKSQDGKTAYLGIQDSDKIAVVSVPARKIIRIIETPKGAGPDTVAPLE